MPCDSLADFDMLMGHEIANEIRKTRKAGRKLALILPVGPMGMYRWVVFFLNEWKTPCDHVYGFNMDEWSDRQGNTLPPTNPGAFQYAMEQAFYRSARQAHRAEEPAELRGAQQPADLSRQDPAT